MRVRTIGGGWAFATFASHEEMWHFYFRVRGYGLYFSWCERPLFSERMGLRYVWRAGKLAVERLIPGKAPGQ
jgi:hypothetical protein